MIVSFRHKGLSALFKTGTPRGVKADHVKRLRHILHLLSQIKDVAELQGFPGLRLHPLKGNMAGSWAVSVSGNWRVVFRMNGQDVMDVDYLDYH